MIQILLIIQPRQRTNFRGPFNFFILAKNPSFVGRQTQNFRPSFGFTKKITEAEKEILSLITNLPVHPNCGWSKVNFPQSETGEFAFRRVYKAPGLKPPDGVVSVRKMTNWILLNNSSSHLPRFLVFRFYMFKREHHTSHIGQQNFIPKKGKLYFFSIPTLSFLTYLIKDFIQFSYCALVGVLGDNE